MEANIQIRKHSVLETYLEYFINEVETLVHHGLVKRYRESVGNQNALKGKLLFHQHITRNVVHAERFFVAHQVYDQNHIYNAILSQALQCIRLLNVSEGIGNQAAAIMLSFPECHPMSISERLFERLSFDRKTERYRTAIALAKIILLNYHPDVKGGGNNILAIMFDMNILWENYLYVMLKKASNRFPGVTIHAQQKQRFWQHPDGWNLHLKPDLIVSYPDKTVLLDTKWKYKKDTSAEDVRQMYAYGNYFGSRESYLLYPDHLEGEYGLRKKKGNFYEPGSQVISEQECGLLFVDLIKKNQKTKGILNKSIGTNILACLG